MAGRLQAQYAGLLSATSAYVEKVRPQFLSLRHMTLFSLIFYGFLEENPRENIGTARAQKDAYAGP